MRDWIGGVRPVDSMLVAAVIVAVLVALATRGRGGRFRGMTGWAGFWVFFAGILVSLERTWPWISFTLLGLLMFAGLRTYFFLVPLRGRDRNAILAAYLSIPVALYPALRGSTATFLAVVPIVLFLLFPVLLSHGGRDEGLLDSVGRTLLGVLFFVFCTAHLGLLARGERPELLALFGILVLAAELPQRVAGRIGDGGGWPQTAFGLLASAVLSVAAGFRWGPVCGLVEEDGGRAGLLVCIAVTLGAVVAHALIREQGLAGSASRVGRGAFLERAIPAVYAAPVFFQYLDHFA